MAKESLRSVKNLVKKALLDNPKGLSVSQLREMIKPEKQFRAEKAIAGLEKSGEVALDHIGPDCSAIYAATAKASRDKGGIITTTREEANQAYEQLVELPASPENDDQRVALCLKMIKGAKSTDELKSTFEDAALITSIEKRDRVWLAAIEEGKRFKTEGWKKDIEKVANLMCMDRTYKDYAGKEITDGICC